MHRSIAQADLWDVIVVGAGPAGLNAALVLGRCRRSVLVFDDAKPRNAVSHAMHGFLSRDGTAPEQLRAIAREQMAAYPSVNIEQVRVCRFTFNLSLLNFHLALTPSMCHQINRQRQISSSLCASKSPKRMAQHLSFGR